MLRWKVLLAAAIGIAIFVAFFIFVSISPIPVAGGVQPATAGAMLAVITAAAVGIERVIEMFWSLVGQLANGWWPFNKMFTEVTALEQDVKNRLGAAQAELESALTKAGGVVDEGTTRLAQALDEMTKLQGRVADLENLAPGNQRVSLIAATVTQGMGMVVQYRPQIDYNLRLIDQSVAGLTDFAASFKENPARRIINIWAGAMIGLIIAYFVRMDVFFAVLGEAATPANWWPHLGVALTGLIIGLGSNPTHDVIAALQEVKKYRASQNQPSATSAETVVVAAGAASGGLEAVPGPGVVSETTPAAPPVRRFR
jgi:hypothetical protein